MKAIPNILSGYRLFSFPVLMYLIYIEEQSIFSWLFCVNLLTDVLDGWIARSFNASTPFGAKLDSLADIGSYILAIYAIYQFYWSDFIPYRSWFFSFLFLYIVAISFSLIKFKTFPSLHLYSFKISGYLQGIFLAVLFLYKFVPWLFILSMIAGIIANLEELFSLVKLKKMKSDIGSYFNL